MNGVYYNEYYDNKTGLLLDKDTAFMIMEKESEYTDIIDNKSSNETDKEIEDLIDRRNLNKPVDIIAGEYRPNLTNEDYYDQIAWGSNDNNFNEDNLYVDYWSVNNGDY